MLNHLILIRLSKKAPVSLVSNLEILVEPLRVCVTSVAKDPQVPQQVERNNELIRSCLRSIVAINKIPDIEAAPKFQDFLKTTVQQGELGKTYQEVLNSER